MRFRTGASQCNAHAERSSSPPGTTNPGSERNVMELSLKISSYTDGLRNRSNTTTTQPATPNQAIG